MTKWSGLSPSPYSSPLKGEEIMPSPPPASLSPASLQSERPEEPVLKRSEELVLSIVEGMQTPLESASGGPLTGEKGIKGMG